MKAKFSSILAAAVFLVTLSVTIDVYSQVTYPRPSQRQSIEQTIGDTEVRIVYHRPNLNGRNAFGREEVIVPYGRVWRAGANEATLFEFTNDVKVNGKDLGKGKYSFYVIPTEDEWTVIFNESWDQWGTQYDSAKDAVRFEVTPVISGQSMETLSYSVGDVTDSKARIALEWENIRIPFTVDVGDVNGRILSAVRREMVSDPVNAANFVLSKEIKSSYEEAIGWLDGSLSIVESYGALFAKARLLGELGRRAEAVSAGERALEVGKQANVNRSSLIFLERLVTSWKSEE